jgi:tRNA (pseudouridine54-N1)-methyltransferase
MRRDVELFLVLQGEPDPPKTIKLVGSELKYLNPDERSTGALIRNALLKKAYSHEQMSTPGIYISRKGFEEILESLAAISKIIYLREDGESFNPAPDSGDLTFILGDDKNLTEEEEAVVLKHEPAIISLGPVSYHSDHCIILVHNALDGVSTA